MSGLDRYYPSFADAKDHRSHHYAADVSVALRIHPFSLSTGVHGSSTGHLRNRPQWHVRLDLGTLDRRYRDPASAAAYQ